MGLDDNEPGQQRDTHVTKSKSNFAVLTFLKTNSIPTLAVTHYI